MWTVLGSAVAVWCPPLYAFVPGATACALSGLAPDLTKTVTVNILPTFQEL